MGIGFLRPLYINLTRIVPDGRGGGVIMAASQLRMSSSSYTGKARYHFCFSLVAFVGSVFSWYV